MATNTIPPMADRLFLLILSSVPLVGIFSSKAMVPLLILAGLAVIAAAVRTGGGYRVPPLPALGLAVLLAWTGLSGIWSIETGRTLALLLPLAGLFALGLLVAGAAPVTGAAPVLAARALINGYGAALAVFLFEAISGNWLTRTGRGLEWIDILDPGSGGLNVDAFLKNGVVILTLFLWPVLGVLVRNQQFILAGLYPALLIFLQFRYGSETSFLALAAGAVSAVAILLARAKAAAAVIAVLFAGIVLVGPFLAAGPLSGVTAENVLQKVEQARLPVSGVNRLMTWKFAAGRIAERPVLGWGGGTSAVLPGGGEKYTIYRKDGDPRSGVLIRDFFIPLHPHNQVFQLWLELGAAGAAIVALFGGLLIFRAGWDGSRQRAAVLTAAILSIFVFDGLSFGMWQNWWIAVQFLTVAAVLTVLPREGAG